MEKSDLTSRWTRVGFVFGLSACTSYPVLLLVPMNAPLTVAVACTFGLSLSVASIGLYHLLALHRETVSLQLGTISNVIAGTVVNMMLVIQLAIHYTLAGFVADAESDLTRESLSWIWRSVDQVQLGLDVVWDVYVALGTVLIAFNMLRHPRFGKLIAVAGMAVGGILLFLNLFSFPTPPSDAGLVDLGPVLGLWYLAVTIQVGRSFKWVDEELDRSI